MPATPSMQSSKILFTHYRLTFSMILGGLILLAISILVFRNGHGNYEQALGIFPLAGAVFLLILCPLVRKHEETVQKNDGTTHQKVCTRLKARLKKTHQARRKLMGNESRNTQKTSTARQF